MFGRLRGKTRPRAPAHPDDARAWTGVQAGADETTLRNYPHVPRSLCRAQAFADLFVDDAATRERRAVNGARAATGGAT